MRRRPGKLPEEKKVARIAQLIKQAGVASTKTDKNGDKALVELLRIAREDLATLKTAEPVYIAPAVMGVISAAKSVHSKYAIEAIDAVDQLTKELLKYVGAAQPGTANATIVDGLLLSKRSPLVSLREEFNLREIEIPSNNKETVQPLPDSVVRSSKKRVAVDVPASDPNSVITVHDESKAAQEAEDEAYARQLAMELGWDLPPRAARGAGRQLFNPSSGSGGDSQWQDNATTTTNKGGETKRPRTGPRGSGSA